jgi:hypothetical protein
MRKEVSAFLSKKGLLFLLAGLSVFIIPNLVLGQIQKEDEWEKITLFVTKKSEIEQLYGKPVDEFEDGDTFVYDTKFGKLTIYYRAKKDSNNSNCKWNVSSETVVGVRVGLFESIPVKKIKYNLSDFEKKINHNEEITYQNREKGIAISSYFSDSREELVSTIYYYPSLSDRKSKCVLLEKEK